MKPISYSPVFLLALFAVPLTLGTVMPQSSLAANVNEIVNPQITDVVAEQPVPVFENSVNAQNQQNILSQAATTQGAETSNSESKEAPEGSKN